MDVWQSSCTLLDARSATHAWPKLPVLSRRCVLTLVCLVLFYAVTSSARSNSQDSSGPAGLTARVDQILADSKFAIPIPLAPDASLARRLYIDLCGMRPTLDQVTEYLSDENPDRYQALVDRLMASPEFIEHWAEKLDVMLMERRANTHVPQDQWSQWLRDQISSDRPLNQWLADLITADGYPAEQRPAARFFLDRAADPHLITRDLGRIYFGRDLQCAQCHDHPNIESYLQSDYHGLLSFVSSISLVEVPEGEAKIQVLAEKSPNDAAFESVFARGKFQRVLPKVPASDEAEKLETIPGEEYAAAEIAGYPSRPLHGRRQQLANMIRSGQQREFNRTLANRLFGMVFGRSVIEPPDLIHHENPPLHPALLDVLADELQQNQFSLRMFVRQLVLTNAYKLNEPPVRYELPSENTNGHLTLRRPDWFDSAVQSAIAMSNDLDAYIESIMPQLESAQQAYEASLLAFEPVESERVQALAAVDTARTTYSQAFEAKNKSTVERDAAAATVDLLNDKLAKLQAARDAAAVASAAVGEDAEITAAIEMLKRKEQTLAAGLPTAQETLVAKQQALAAAIEKAAADRSALTTSQAAATDVDARHSVVRQSLLKARLDLEALSTERSRLIAYRRSFTHILDLESAYKILDELQRQRMDFESKVTQAQEKADSRQQLSTMQLGVSQAQQELNDHDARIDAQQLLITKSLQQVQEMLGDRLLAGRLTPLMPEQMGWSFLSVTGVYQRYIDKHLGELETQAPATEEQKQDPSWLRMRRAQAIRRARAELQGNINHFITLYGAGAGQPQSDFFATPDQALYASNGGALFAWAGAAAGNVAEKMAQANDASTAAKILFLGVLGREPSATECNVVAEYLSEPNASEPNASANEPEEQTAVQPSLVEPAKRVHLAQELVWSLMASAEFRFNN